MLTEGWIFLNDTGKLLLNKSLKIIGASKHDFVYNIKIGFTDLQFTLTNIFLYSINSCTKFQQPLEKLLNYSIVKRISPNLF